MAKKIGCIQHDCEVCEARAKRVSGQPEMIYIEWVDSTRTEGWCTPKEIAEVGPLLCKTAGFLVREDDTAIVIALSASNLHAGSPYCSLMTVPKFAITLRAGIEAHYLPSAVLPKGNK